ncbi:rod shape-determining protein RodA [Numidum massiliense]|uniref:rod shape-determining protein RodA n=1 Tax=Numidum massiliense TaxID=1522315 RepID=UPI00164E63A3|nr:rod shape-determining protein RodA [Numidum massiliense]
MKEKREQPMLRYFDFPLIIILLGLMAVSILAISSAKFNEPSFVQKQLIFYGLGFAAIIVIQFFDYRHLKRFSFWLYGIGVVLLVLVRVIGREEKGETRWLGIGGFQFQPSDLMKIFLIIALAKVMADLNEAPIRSWKSLGKIFGLFIVPFAFVVQGDLGTAIIMMAIFASMLLVAGLDWRILVTCVLIVVLAIGSVFYVYFNHTDMLEKVLKPHQFQRIQTFVEPTADISAKGYQVYQGTVAIGSGGLMGKGFREGTQVQGRWVPESHNDFVFTVIGEEYGFIGVSVLICLFIFLIYRMVLIALSSNDFFGSYIVAGVIGMLVFQVFQNIGMTIGLMPVTGINLPFISYGGTSLLSVMIAVGLVINVGMRRNKPFYYDAVDK